MSDYEQLLLQPDRPLRLDVKRHAEFRVESGTVWITASGAAGDLFLEAGKSYRVPEDGMVMVEAVRGTAGVRLVACRQSSVAELWERWRGFLAGAVAQY